MTDIRVRDYNAILAPCQNGSPHTTSAPLVAVAHPTRILGSAFNGAGPVSVLGSEMPMVNWLERHPYAAVALLMTVCLLPYWCLVSIVTGGWAIDLLVFWPFTSAALTGMNVAFFRFQNGR